MTAVNGAVRLRDVTVSYAHRPAISQVSGQFGAGSLTAVVGPNGAGKSTLLKTIAGMLRPVHGTVERGGRRRGNVSYLPQQAEIDRDFPVSVMDTVLLGHWRRVGPFRAITRPLHDEAARALDAVGLHGYANRRIGALSAGQFQRVLFARVLLQDCAVILLDEPFNAIDARTTADLLGVVHRWHREGRTVIAALHDFEQVRTHFPYTLLLACELIDWGETARVMRPQQLMRAGVMTEVRDDLAVLDRRRSA